MRNPLTWTDFGANLRNSNGRSENIHSAFVIPKRSDCVYTGCEEDNIKAITVTLNANDVQFNDRDTYGLWRERSWDVSFHLPADCGGQQRDSHRR